MRETKVEDASAKRNRSLDRLNEKRAKQSARRMKRSQDPMFTLNSEALAIRCAELLNTMVCIDKLYSEEEDIMEGGKMKIKRKRKCTKGRR